MEKFRENVDRLNKDEEFRLLFSEEEDALRTHNTLMAESEEAGIEQGQKEKAIEIAKNLLKLQMEPSDIAKATGLSEKEIQALNN